MTPRRRSNSLSEIVRMIVATGLIVTLLFTTGPIAAGAETLTAPPQENTRTHAGTANHLFPAEALMMPSVARSANQAGGASGPITIPSTSAAAIALGSAVHYRLSQDSQWSDYEEVIVIAVLNGMAKMAANSGSSLSSSEYDQIKSQVREWLDSKAPQNPTFSDEVTCLRYAINALVPLATSSPANSLLPAVLGNLENEKFVRLETPIDPSRQRPSDLGFYAVSEHSGSFIMDVMQEASDLAHNDPRYAAAINPVLRDLAGMDTGSSYYDIQSEYQGAIPSLPPANSDDGSFTIALQDLKGQYLSIVSDAQSVVDGYLVSIQQSAPTVSLKAGPLVAQSGPPCTAGTVIITANQCTTASGASSDYWSKAQSGVDGLSKLIGKFDSQASMQVSTVGNAVIQAGKAIGQISNILGGGSLGFASLIGLVNPVAGVISAGFSIFQSFFGGQGSQDSAVMDQIKKLSQQIAALQQDVDQQFLRVNAELGTILQTLNNDFLFVNWELGVVQGDAHQIAVGLLDVQSQINQLEQYTLVYDQAISKETLISEMNGCLYYATVHNGQDIGGAAYTACENDFYSWAHDNASDQLWAGILQPDYSDRNIYSTLSNFPLSVNENYVGQFPAQNLNLPALSATRLANVNEFILGARAYLELSHEWNYAAQINSSRINDLILTGQTLRQAMVNGNSINGDPNNPNQALFTALTNKHTTAINNLKSAIQADADNYVADPRNGITNQSSGITLNLWAGGANQKAPWRPTISSIQFCDGTGPVLPAPSSLLATVPELYAFSQGYLGSGQLSMCISGVTWANTQAVNTPATCPPRGSNLPSPPRNSNGKAYCLAIKDGVAEPREAQIYRFVPGDIQTFADIAVTLDVSFGGRTVMTDTVQSATGLIQEDQTYKCGGTAGGAPWGSQMALIYCGFVIPSSINPHGSGWVPVKTTTDLKTALAQNWSTGLNLQQQLTSSGQITQVPQPELLASIASQIDSVIATHQHNIYATISNDFAAQSQVQTAGQFLNATKLAVGAYANLSLPVSTRNNTTLQSEITGDQSLFDASAVQADFANYSTAAITDTTDNKIADEVSAMTSRLTNLSGTFNNILSGIRQSHTPESLPELDETLADLQALVILKDAQALSPCRYVLATPSSSVSPTGGAITVQVQVPRNCHWIANTNSSWLTFTSPSSGSGSGTITLNADANELSAREAIVIVGDQIFRVEQAANSGVSMLTVSNMGDGTVTDQKGNISCGTNCSYSYGNGEQVTLTGVPSTGWAFGAWNGCDSVNGNGCQLKMNTDRNVTASFTQTQQGFTLSLSASPAPAGSIRANPSPEGGTYLSGTHVCLSAAPDAGWVFGSWSGAAVDANGCIVMTANLTVTANFLPYTAPAGLRFIPVTPCRVVDTRLANGPFGGPSLVAKNSRDFAISDGTCGIPSTAVAYSLNVTVVPHGPLGYLTLSPAGTSTPLVSTLNSLDGRVKANAAIVPAGVGNAVSVFVTDATDVVLDINGYFVPATDPSALAFYPVTPCRLVDTRQADGELGGPRLQARQVRDFPVISGPCKIPNTAQAYVMNFTVVPSSPLGHLTVWPSDQEQPWVSTLNAPTGEVTANAAIVPAAGDGHIKVFATDDTELVDDVLGYFAPAGAGGQSLYPINPCRVLDSRQTTTGAFLGTLSVNVLDSPCKIPAAEAYVLNVTVVPQSRLHYLTLWTDGEPQPNVSTLNAPDGAITSNMSIVPTANGSIDVFSTDSTQLVLDISGYFAP